MRFQTSANFATIVGAILAAIPFLPTLSCPIFGAFCGASALPPNLETTTRKDKSAIAAKFASATGLKSFEGLRVDYIGSWFSSWFWSPRLAIYAQFDDLTALLVDTIQFKFDDYSELAAQDKKVVGISVSKTDRFWPNATLYAYFPEAGFLKRQFVLKCRSDTYANITISNIGFNPADNKLQFDFVSGCNPVFVQETYKLQTPAGSTVSTTGDTVTLKLKEGFYIESVTTGMDERGAETRKLRREEAKKQLAECESRIGADANKTDGDLFPCYLDLLFPEGGGPGYIMLQWNGGKIRQLGSLESAEPPIKDAENRAFFLVSASRALAPIFLASDVQTVRLKVVTATRFSASAFEFRGYCKNMSIVPEKIVDANGSVQLKLETDCSDIYVDGAKYPTRLKPTDGKKYSTAPFVLELNANRLVADFRPL